MIIQTLKIKDKVEKIALYKKDGCLSEQTEWETAFQVDTNSHRDFDPVSLTNLKEALFLPFFATWIGDVRTDRVFANSACWLILWFAKKICL
jgi:hypothetical protein